MNENQSVSSEQQQQQQHNASDYVSTNDIEIIDDIDDDEDINYDDGVAHEVIINASDGNDSDVNYDEDLDDYRIENKTEFDVDDEKNLNYDDLYCKKNVKTDNDNDDYHADDGDGNIHDKCDGDNDLVYGCKICSNFFNTEEILSEHILIQHKVHADFKVQYMDIGNKKEKRVYAPKWLINKPLKCDLCTLDFYAVSALRNHRAKVHHGKLFINFFSY